ncbi:peptidoglycan-binding protein LysM [Sulfitobacter mediterraneus]|jgi:nucleoid-associated protein YgaU|uniref:Peptidoglycan-binding protein LysM n=1 Tax=Sulfitobacter mediterraneus TaxID=83219 RepID=A0A061SSL7_9RHOB|nr:MULTISPECIES: peptidoglycan-binding protein LysM [Sulfitobacter]KAJ02648.1 peptidoglycan-binding protein LysM [Sulfitobacter mediterraneus]MBM1310943.1 peptidoglycan-binding protein LysM [Sulfitobacter mediterraneus]MBM1314826.1 peptidoglycan-binding protein LysM [Sulfitobacter mediterraneus]MBM1323186.1 peptidoglycan-binding protein LysM [Sulfitobacter mediterraneus]MBM1327098.1 peptidoglycan-binding protein LysM [Sulfitobacter mediterraneus]
MGLWSFVKDAGKKVFGGGDDEEVTGAALKDELKELGLDSDDLDITVEGDTVKVSGKAASQEMKEKVILAVGNVEGVAAVEDDVSGGDADPVFHTVEKGDTLWAVSEKALGKGSRYMEIFEANKPMLSDPDKIYPGQVLRIPAA